MKLAYRYTRVSTVPVCSLYMAKHFEKTRATSR